MTTRNASSVVVLSLLTVGCATTSASKGTEVAVVSQAPSDCRALGPVSGSYQPVGTIGGSRQAIVSGAQQDLVENAAKQGATHVVIEASSMPMPYSGSATGTAYQCPKVATTK